MSWKISLFAALTHALVAFATGKRGLGWPSDNFFDPDIFVSSQVTFLFNWGVENPPLNTEFPYWVTQWGSGGIEQLSNVVSTVNPPVLLTFNEPDNPGQANISPTEAANLWKQYIQPLAQPGRKLIAPAVTNGVAAGTGTSWLDEFFAACEGCHFDGVAGHWYGGWMDDFQEFIESLKKYNKPIYLTEFGFSWDADASVDSFTEFLPLAMDYLDNEDAVVAYAFFGAFHSGTAKDMITAQGTLTAVGELYVSS